MRTTRRLLALLTLTLTLNFAAPPAHAVTDMYLQVVGSVQGNIPGSALQAHHANWITVDSYSLGLTIPIGTNGQPSGAATTTPLTLTKLFDRSSVKLVTAASTQETFSTWTLDFHDPALNQTVFRVTLTGGRVASVSQAGASGGELTEALSFMYTSITLNDIARGFSVSYPWNSSGATATVNPGELLRGFLLPPAPNPTRGRTDFRFTIPAGAEAELTLFDVQGRQVRELHRGWVARGPALATWDGTDDHGAKVPEGVYMARLKHGDVVLTQRVNVVR